MWIWILCIYLFILLLTILVLTTGMYNLYKNDGERKAIVEVTKMFFIAFIPIGAQILCVISARDRIDEWVKKDPTSPENMNNPNFELSDKEIEKQAKREEKKERRLKKKEEKERIKNRFEILDI